MNKLLILTVALIIGAGFYRLLTDGHTAQTPPTLTNAKTTNTTNARTSTRQDQHTPGPQTPQTPQTPKPQTPHTPQTPQTPQTPKPQTPQTPQTRHTPQPQPHTPHTPQPQSSTICKAGFNPVPSTEWDSAYFVSGGTNSAYSISDIGKAERDLIPNCPNGADATCGAFDEITMNKCIKTGKDKYNIKYATAYNALLKNNYCKAGSEFISLVNPEGGGKVAVLEHGPFGTQLIHKPNCSTSHFDRTVGGTPAGYEARRDKLAALLKNCGNDDNPNTFVYTDTEDSSLKSCLITKDALNRAGITGEVPISNKGAAIASGHGFGDGGCGAVFLLQQGKAPGTHSPAIRIQETQ